MTAVRSPRASSITVPGSGLGADVSIGSEHRAVSDARGAFSLSGVPRQPARLGARRIGYRPTTVGIAPGGLAPGASLEVAVILVPGVVTLETVTVEGRAYDRALWDAGFYRRQQRGRGRFVDADEFARFGGSGIGTILKETPRVMVERKGNDEYA